MASNTNRAIQVMVILLTALVFQSNGQANETIETIETIETSEPSEPSEPSVKIETSEPSLKIETSEPSVKNETSETTEASDADLDKLLSEVFYTNSSTGPDTTRVGETDNVSLNKSIIKKLRDKIYLQIFSQ